MKSKNKQSHFAKSYGSVFDVLLRPGAPIAFIGTALEETDLAFFA